MLGHDKILQCPYYAKYYTKYDGAYHPEGCLKSLDTTLIKRYVFFKVDGVYICCECQPNNENHIKHLLTQTPSDNRKIGYCSIIIETIEAEELKKQKDYLLAIKKL